MKTKLTFCAIEQIDTEHVVTIDQNGEYLFKCECGAFFKLPAHFEKKDIEKALELNKLHNEGQVSQAVIEKANEEKLKNI